MENQIFLRLKNVNKVYPNGIQAVYDFNLLVNKEEFIVFVGPSGCGKSTTLRMIAGLEDITRGDLYIDQRLANNLSPKERDIAMVFQSYALYPHMNVYNNLAFGLKMRRVKENVLNSQGEVDLKIDDQQVKKINRSLKYIKDDIEKVEKSLLKAQSIADLEKKEITLEQLASLQQSLENEKIKKEAELAYFMTTAVPHYHYRAYKKSEIDEKVRKAAEILDIKDYLLARPRELSGGQRQRVALGRSIVRNARLFLMDEPLSNLDAKLRVSMRSEIVSLHRALKATTIYVTHDQIEAMTMADRIVVMKDGYIQQVGTPLDIYHQPINVFVATFMGSPAMNIFKSVYDSNRVNINEFVYELTNIEQEKVVKFIDGQIDKLINKNKQLSSYIESYEAEKASEKNAFRVKKLLQNITDKTAALNKNKDLIEQYQNYQKEKQQEILVGIRPENIAISHAKKTKNITAKVTFVELLGKEYYVHLLINNTKVIASVSPKETYAIGDEVYLDFDDNALNLFDPLSEMRIS
jgi:ABC-type sugar transport system ATPase subunit